MDEQLNRVGRRERQIIDLLLQGCDNSEIAQDLNIAERTVKAHFNRLFLRFGIKGGIKRVKLATMLYRRQLWSEKQSTPEDPAKENMPSSNLSPKAARTGKLRIPSALQNTSSRIISA
jgi:regulatory LuxR family protein